MILDIFVTFFVIALIILVTRSWLTIHSFAPWVPAFKKDLPRIFRLAKVQPGEVFYDLGCGDGRTVVYAAEQFKAQAIGVELIFPLFVVCQLRKFFSQSKSIKFKNKNLFHEDLSGADVVYVFGIPRTLAHRVKEKFQKELKPGARVVSYVFKIEGLTPVAVDKPNAKDNSIYLYKF